MDIINDIDVTAVNSEFVQQGLHPEIKLQQTDELSHKNSGLNSDRSTFSVMSCDFSDVDFASLSAQFKFHTWSQN